MKAKKILLTSIIATQVLTATVLAAPDEAIKEFKKVAPIKQEVKHFQGEVKLFIIKDGEKVRVDQKMTDGLRVVNGRTCVGVRDLVNAIEGAKVEWDGTNHIVDITYADKTISYPVGKPLMWADGKAVTIDVPAQIDPAISKTFLPIRNIAETLGFKVDWDNKAKEVVLTPGAGTGITTAAAQQPRPTTQTPTQNKNLAWVTASGQRIPKPEELPTARLDKVGGRVDPECYSKIKYKDGDITQNPDGSRTYFKGTAIEFTVPPYFAYESNGYKPYKKPAGFKILSPNTFNDPRVGKAIFTKGDPKYDKELNNEYLNVTGKASTRGFMFDIDALKGYYTEENEIPYEQVVKEFKNADLSQLSDFYREDIKTDIKNHKKWYDFTGIVNVSIIGASNVKNWQQLFITSDPLLITKEGKIINPLELKYVKNLDCIIDKAIFTGFRNYVVDIPDFNLKDYFKTIKYKNAYMNFCEQFKGVWLVK